MNLQDLTVTTANGEIHVLDSLNAALLELNIKRNLSTIEPNDNSLIVYVDKNPSYNPSNSRKQYVFDLDSKLHYLNGVSDELKLKTMIKDNDVVFRAFVEKKIGDNNTILNDAIINELEGIPIVLFEGENYIYTNYANSDITLVYPKNVDGLNILLCNSIFAGYRNNSTSDFCLDDIYFKDVFTKVGNNIDAELNGLSVDCLDSNLDNFSLDSNGNLMVQTLGVTNSINANSISSNNNTFSIDANGNISSNGTITGDNLNVYSIASRITGKFSLDSNGNLSVKSLNVNGNSITGSNNGLTQSEVCNLIYPVGSIYLSVNNINPSTLFGGTWVSWGNGRVPISVNTSDSDFSTVEKTGGNKNHDHTIGGHYHNLDGSNAYAQVNYTGGRSYLKGRSRTNWTPTDALTGTSTYSSKPSNNWGADVLGKTQNSSDFTSGSASNLMPYITCYMWKRTA